MITEDTINDIKIKHRGDFITLFRIFKKDDRLLKSQQMWSAIILTVICSHIIFGNCNPVSVLNILSKLVERILSVLPNILGFTLTGYVLIVGIGWSEFLDTITDQDDSGYSLFQQISSIFAWGTIIQSSTLIISYIISLIRDIKISTQYANTINDIILLLIMFLSFYSLFLVIKLVINVFHYGQLVQYFYTEKKLIEKIKEQEKAQGNKQ